MPAWVISLLIAVGAATWIYTKLARLNGNAVPRNNAIAAAAAGFAIFIVFLSLTKLILGF